MNHGDNCAICARDLGAGEFAWTITVHDLISMYCTICATCMDRYPDVTVAANPITFVEEARIDYLKHGKRA